MRLPHIPNDLKLTFRVPFIHHDASIQGADDEEAVFFQEYKADDGFVLVLVVFSRLDLL